MKSKIRDIKTKKAHKKISDEYFSEDAFENEHKLDTLYQGYMQIQEGISHICHQTAIRFINTITEDTASDFRL